MIKNGVVVGVEFLKNTTKHQIKARKEVILSAGTIGSAKILMASGIGPKEHLKQLKVTRLWDIYSL